MIRPKRAQPFIPKCGFVRTTVQIFQYSETMTCFPIVGMLFSARQEEIPCRGGVAQLQHDFREVLYN
jgi:hypothetical protein